MSVVPDSLFTGGGNGVGTLSIVGKNVSSPDYNVGTVVNPTTGKPAGVMYGSTAASQGVTVKKTTTPPPTTQSSGDARLAAWRAAGNTGDLPVGWNGANQADLDAQKAEMEARQRSAINASFEPIFAELDRQIGGLDPQRAQIEGQVGNLATSQRTSAENERTRGLAQLDQSEVEERSNTKGSLRNLEQDIRNALQAQQFYFGAKGAGDSSAPLMASEAVSRAGLKTRGTILDTENKALNDINLKRTDVNNLASDQLSKIDEWKSTKMFEVGQWYTDQLNKLNQEKAQAGSERGRAIAQLIQGLDQDFLNRARQLDDQATQYAQGVQMWQMQRQAELEDYATKLSLQAKYSGGGDNLKVMNAAMKAFSDMVNLNVPANAAAETVSALYGVNPLEGATLTQTQLESIKRKESANPWALLGAGDTSNGMSFSNEDLGYGY